MSAMFLMAAAVLAQGFDCQLAAPRVVSLNEGASNAQAIGGLPKETLRFRMVLKGNNAEVVWKDSPIQMEGKQVVLSTSPTSGMIMFLSAGPCLFTETSCGTMVNYGKQPDGTLQLIIMPSAILSDKEKQVRTPFLVAIPGQCMPAKDVK